MCATPDNFSLLHLLVRSMLVTGKIMNVSKHIISAYDRSKNHGSM